MPTTGTPDRFKGSFADFVVNRASQRNQQALAGGKFQPVYTRTPDQLAPEPPQQQAGSMTPEQMYAQTHKMDPSKMTMQAYVQQKRQPAQHTPSYTRTPDQLAQAPQPELATRNKPQQAPNPANFPQNPQASNIPAPATAQALEQARTSTGTAGLFPALPKPSPTAAQQRPAPRPKPKERPLAIGT